AAPAVEGYSSRARAPPAAAWESRRTAGPVESSTAESGRAERTLCNHGRLRSGQYATDGARVYRPARAGEGAGAGGIRRGLGAVRVEYSAVAHLRGDRRAAGRAQAARQRARGRARPVGRAGARDVSALAEVPLPRAQVRLRRAAIRRARHRSRAPGGAAAGGVRGLGL